MQFRDAGDVLSITHCNLGVHDTLCLDVQQVLGAVGANSDHAWPGRRHDQVIGVCEWLRCEAKSGTYIQNGHQIATNANQPLHDRRSLGQGDDGDRAHHFLDLRRWQGVADTSDIEHEYVHVNLGSASTLSLQRSPTAGLASLHDVSGWRETAEL